MSNSANIGPGILQTSILTSGNNFISFQTNNDLFAEQQILELPVDAGLAYEIKQFQLQTKKSALNFSDQNSDFIDVISESSNFISLWDSAYSEDISLISETAKNDEAKTDAFNTFKALSIAAGTVQQKANALASDMEALSDAQNVTNTRLSSLLSSAISDLDSDAAKISTEIDQLKTEINQNINDIVEGAEKAGAATSELLVGILTTISDAKADNGGGKDGGGGDSGGGDAGGGGDSGGDDSGGGEEQASGDADAGDDSGGDSGGGDGGGGESGGDTPSTDFVVSAIKGATDGVAETAQARADLNANNENLAAAVQKLAEIEALVAVAKVVAVQDDLFRSAVSAFQASTKELATLWGRPPIAPPASGISGNMAQFGFEIKGVSSQQEANLLVEQMEYANNDWAGVGKNLARLKQRLVNV